jgi:hypothetical protein
MRGWAMGEIDRSLIMRRLPLMAAAFSFASACSNALARDSAHWMQVARDANYTISIDTARIEVPEHRQWYVVWYRTEHAQPRLHKGKPFNRETVKSLLRCDDYSFKIASIDMSIGAGHIVATQRATADEIAKQPWRNVERWTIEETVARAACDVARQRRKPA